MTTSEGLSRFLSPSCFFWMPQYSPPWSWVVQAVARILSSSAEAFRCCLPSVTHAEQTIPVFNSGPQVWMSMAWHGKDNQGFFFHRSATAYPTIWRAFLDGVL